MVENLPLFFISTGKRWQKILVALGGINAIDFHRYVPILHRDGKWWQMMDKMPPFSTLFINPLFFHSFSPLMENTHLSSFQYSIVFHRNRWHFYRRVMINYIQYLWKNVFWSAFGCSNIAFINSCHFIIVPYLTLWVLLSGCQTVWIQIGPNILLGLIWVQTVRRVYQQKTEVIASGQRVRYRTTCDTTL